MSYHSNSNYSLHRLRSNVYRLDLGLYTSVVLRSTEDWGIEVWAKDVDGKPTKVVTLFTPLFTPFVNEAIEMIAGGECEALNSFWEEQAFVANQRNEIEAELGYERFLETRYALEYDAMPERAK